MAINEARVATASSPRLTNGLRTPAVPSVPPAQIPFAHQQLSKQSILVNRVTAREEIFDPRLVAGKPGRFERVTNRVHTCRRRRRTGLFAM